MWFIFLKCTPEVHACTTSLSGARYQKCTQGTEHTLLRSHEVHARYQKLVTKVGKKKKKKKKKQQWARLRRRRSTIFLIGRKQEKF